MQQHDDSVDGQGDDGQMQAMQQEEQMMHMDPNQMQQMTEEEMIQMQQQQMQFDLSQMTPDQQ